MSIYIFKINIILFGILIIKFVDLFNEFYESSPYVRLALSIFIIYQYIY
jgi:hypothetical protein